MKVRTAQAAGFIVAIVYDNKDGDPVASNGFFLHSTLYLCYYQFTIAYISHSYDFIAMILYRRKHFFDWHLANI